MGDPTSFEAAHWGRTPMHRTTDGARLPLDVAALDEWVAHGARRPNLRMVQAGRTLDERAYTRSVRLGGVWVDGVADPGKVASLIATGATLVGQNLEVVIPAVRRFVDEVQAEVTHPVQANAYLTPANAAGLGRHADTHDVVVVQVEGHKTWRVDDLGEVRMAPGDVLYVPRGTAHEAWTDDAASLHLTLGVLCVTASQVVRSLLDRVDGADRRLPLGYATRDAGALHDVLAGYLERLSASALAVDGAAVVTAGRARTAGGPGWLAPLLHSEPLAPTTPLRRVAACRWHHEGDRVVLETAERAVSFPAIAASALRAVCELEELTPAALVDLDVESQLVVARRLVREGVLTRVPGA